RGLREVRQLALAEVAETERLEAHTFEHGFRRVRNEYLPGLSEVDEPDQVQDCHATVVSGHETTCVHGAGSRPLLAGRPCLSPQEGPSRRGAGKRIGGVFEHGNAVVGHLFDGQARGGFEGLAYEFAVVGRDFCNNLIAELEQHGREAHEIDSHQRSDASVRVISALVVDAPRRCELPLEPLHAKLEEALWAKDVLEPELAQVSQLELVALEV